MPCNEPTEKKYPMLVRTASLALASFAFLTQPGLSQQNQLWTSWSANVTEFRGQNDRRVTMICPPNGELGDVYGTHVYTDDSYVCTAAVHAGLITREAGGVVTFVVAPGMAAYEGSTRNGVTSKSFRRWDGSYKFDRERAVGQIDWKTTARGIELAREPITVLCPPGGAERVIYGSDPYTDDSSICTAAVHAGLITFASGGAVTLQPAPGREPYAASARNDVSSREYTSAHPGFRVTSGQRVVTNLPVQRETLTPRPPREAPAETTVTESHEIVTGVLSIVGRALDPTRTITTAPLQIIGRAMPSERTITTAPLIVQGTATTN
jgi:hypothetical protein